MWACVFEYVRAYECMCTLSTYETTLRYVDLYAPSAALFHKPSETCMCMCMSVCDSLRIWYSEKLYEIMIRYIMQASAAALFHGPIETCVFVYVCMYMIPYRGHMRSCSVISCMHLQRSFPWANWDTYPKNKNHAIHAFKIHSLIHTSTTLYTLPENLHKNRSKVLRHHFSVHDVHTQAAEYICMFQCAGR